MSVGLGLLFIALALGMIIALVLGLAAGVLTWIDHGRPAGAILRGGATSVAILVVEVAILTLIWTAVAGAV